METKMLKTTTLADSTNLPTMMAGRSHRSQVNPSTSGVFEWGEEIFRAVLEYRENIKLFILQLIAIWLVVEPTHLKNMIVKMGKSSPIFGMKIKNIWNHHLVFILQFYSICFLSKRRIWPSIFSQRTFTILIPFKLPLPSSRNSLQFSGFEMFV